MERKTNLQKNTPTNKRGENMKIDFKTQTNRSTKFHEGITNINLFCNNFQFGIMTSEAWGNFDERKEPIIQLEIEGTVYELPMDKFTGLVKKALRMYAFK